jgi:soluble cytochrome b562
VERSKLGRLFQRRPAEELTAGDDHQEVKSLNPVDAPTELEKSEMYEPPGELATLANSVSKLIVPAVKVDPWSIFWLVAVALTAGTGLLSVLLLTAVPPVPDCKHISIIATDSERLYCAKLGAETNNKAKVIEAINLVKGWSEIDPLYNDGKTLLENWSKQLLRLTKLELANGGNLKQSIADVKQIPTHTPVYKDAQELILQWEEQWSDGKDIAVEFKKALQTFDWNAGYGYLAKVRSFKSAYWYRTKYHEMSIEFAKQKDAWDTFQAADRVAKQREKLPEFFSDDPDNLSKAISMAAAVKSNTYMKPQAQAQRAFWSRKLLALAAAKYAVKDYGNAVEIAQKVPQDVPAYAEAQSWIALSKAPGEKLPSNRSVLAEAHEVAQAGTITAARSAIEIASKIPAGQPLHTEAQGSITNWNNILQYGADQPILEKARSLAKAGELEEAMTVAKTIGPDRGLYRAAQGDIAVWTVQLPLAKNIKTFKAAEVLFLKGKAQEAIDLGKTIPEDSNLYKPMQQYIKYWASTIKTKPSVPPESKQEEAKQDAKQ